MFPGSVYPCGTSWLGSPQPPKIWKLELVLALCCLGGLGCSRGALGLGKGQEHAWLCCMEAARAAALGGLWKMLQLLMHGVISQAGGVTVLIAGEEVPVVLGAVSAQVAAGDAFHLSLLSCRVQSPEGGKGGFWPWSFPGLLWV